MQHTFQGSYRRVFSSDVTGILGISDITKGLLDGSTSGHTYDYSDMPSYAIEIGPEWNRIIGYFVVSQAIDNRNFGCRFWGYTGNGPAELIGDVSGTVGTANYNDLTTTLYADTLTVVSPSTNAGLVCYDCTGDNRVSQFRFDCVGYKYIMLDPYGISAADGYVATPIQGGLNAWIRPF